MGVEPTCLRSLAFTTIHDQTSYSALWSVFAGQSALCLCPCPEHRQLRVPNTLQVEPVLDDHLGGPSPSSGVTHYQAVELLWSFHSKGAEHFLCEDCVGRPAGRQRAA